MEDRNNGSPHRDVFSKRVRAGKRTYFFDVKATRHNDDFYITITESKKRQGEDGYSKHKVFLYKEDFGKFIDGLQDAMDYADQEIASHETERKARHLSQEEKPAMNFTVKEDEITFDEFETITETETGAK